MTFIRAMTSVFNVQTVLLLLGLICMVTGIWSLFGFGIGMLVVNFNTRR